MTQTPPPRSADPTASAPRPADPDRHRRGRAERSCYAALDLGTNNCRLLVATAAGDGFRVVESFSRIVRLGEGLSRTGRLDEAAMDRALAALRICAEKIARRRPVRSRAVATQACRAADNGADFVARIARETGLRLEIITPQEEARLSVVGCLNLIDCGTQAALVVDVGGGSTELSWLDLRRSGSGAGAGASRRGDEAPRVLAWMSAPVGVVTLAERYPEGATGDAAWFRAMVEHMKRELAAAPHAEALRGVFDAGRAHIVGTSGAITSLAGLHLRLARYERARVDGLWMTHAECQAAATGLMRLTPGERAALACIGPDRADLVLAGAAILEAVQELWPCERVRVADRGLREGILLSLIAEDRARLGTRRLYADPRASRALAVSGATS